MTTIKKTFQHKIAEQNGGRVPRKLGGEFAGITKNDSRYYAKTGQWKVVAPKVSAICLACQMCVKNCPEAAIDIKKIDGKNRAAIDYTYCKGCAICADVCPVKAIKMDKK